MTNYEFWNDLDKIFEAIVAYQEKTIEFNKQFVDPWVKLGHVFDKKESNGVIAARKNAVAIAPENAQSWFELAKAYTRAGQFDKSIQAYHQARNLGVESGELYKNLGMAYAMISRYQESIPVLRYSLKLAENKTEKAIIWNHLGNVYRKLNDYQMAFQAFKKADQLEGLIYSNLEERSSVDSSKESSRTSDTKEEESEPAQTTEEVAPLFESIPDHEAENIDVENSDLNLEQENELKGEEQSDFYQSSTYEEEQTQGNERSDTLDDGLPVIFEMDFTTLADYLEAEYPLAEDAAQKGATTDQWTEEDKTPAFEGEQLAKSQPSVEKDMDPDAEDKNSFNFSAYEEYLQDTIEPIRMNLIESQFEKEQTVATSAREANRAAHPEANAVESSADLTVDMETKNPKVWNELGNSYFNAGAIEDAIAAYIRAIELDNLFAWPYTNLAMAYAQIGHSEEAILLYQRSIELFSEEKDKAITWNRLGDLYRRIEEYEKAIEAYQRADDLDPGNPALTNQAKLSLLGSEKVFQGAGAPL